MQARALAVLFLTTVAGCLSRRAEAQAAQPPAGDLAKATQNPVGDLLSLPFQFNFNSGGGVADGRTSYNLNF